MAISEESFTLKEKDSKTINIDIFAKENEIPDAYIGKITVGTKEETKTINLIVEVLAKEPLFDIIIDSLKKRLLRAGESIKANIKIFNKGDLKDIDIILHYAIKNFDGETLTFKEESLAIDQELNVLKELKTPKNIPTGKYIFYTKVSYEISLQQVAKYLR